MIIRNRVVEIAWQILIVLFSFSMFTSKSAVSIAGGLLIIFSFFLTNWSDLWGNQKKALLLISLYPLAIFLNLFSTAGLSASLKVAYSWPWVLLVLPAIIVAGRKRDQYLGLVALICSYLLAFGRSIFIFISQFNAQYLPSMRVASFWDISRWGVFSGVVLIMALGVAAYALQKKAKGTLLVSICFVTMSAVALLLNNSRGPWLAVAVASVVLLFMFPRLLKLVSVFALLLGIVFVVNDGMRSRLASIVNIEAKAGGDFTSSDGSNEGRINMWIVAKDFYWQQPWFGTGFESTREPLVKFMSSNPDYKQRYVTSEFSFHDQHSSFLSIFVQNGGVFGFIFWSVYAYFMFVFFAAWYRDRNVWSGTISALLVFHSIIFVFYSSIQSFEMMTLFPFLAILPSSYARSEVREI